MSLYWSFKKIIITVSQLTKVNMPTRVAPLSMVRHPQQDVSRAIMEGQDPVLVLLQDLVLIQIPIRSWFATPAGSSCLLDLRSTSHFTCLKKPTFLRSLPFFNLLQSRPRESCFFSFSCGKTGKPSQASLAWKGLLFYSSAPLLQLFLHLATS